jgi:hypothetical protein
LIESRRADRGYDAEDFVNELRSMNVRPHVVQNLTRRNGGSALDGRTTRHPGYASSQRSRKRIDESFGSIKTVAGLEPTETARGGPDRMGIHLRRRSLQSCPSARVTGGRQPDDTARLAPLARADRQPGHLRRLTAMKPSSKAAPI